MCEAVDKEVVRLYEELDAMHIRITCDQSGRVWFWENTDTGEEGQTTYITSRDALWAAAEEFGLLYEQNEDPDCNDDDGLTDAEADAMTLKEIGWGTDEDYGYYGDGEY